MAVASIINEYIIGTRINRLKSYFNETIPNVNFNTIVNYMSVYIEDKFV
jgi:hypothetical protein